MMTDPYIVNKPWYKSKKFIAMVLGVFVALGNQLLGWDLDFDALWSIIGPIVAFILGQSYVDGKH